MIEERKCPHCGSMYKFERGFTSNNFKKMFRAPTFSEWIVLILMIMTIVLAYTYKYETKACREMVKNIDNICMVWQKNQLNNKPESRWLNNYSISDYIDDSENNLHNLNNISGEVNRASVIIKENPLLGFNDS